MPRDPYNIVPLLASRVANRRCDNSHMSHGGGAIGEHCAAEMRAFGRGAGCGSSEREWKKGGGSSMGEGHGGDAGGADGGIRGRR